MKELNKNEARIKPPKRKTAKKSTGKTIRISSENYEFLRVKAFNEKTTLKELVDDILDKERYK